MTKNEFCSSPQKSGPTTADDLRDQLHSLHANEARTVDWNRLLAAEDVREVLDHPATLTLKVL